MFLPKFAAPASTRHAARQTGQRLSRPQFQRVMDHVETHLDGRLALRDLAAVARISGPHFSVLFRQTSGYSVHQFVMRRRVVRALKLLRTTGLSITDVALSCGFAHQSHMSRWMTRLAGVTPRWVRREWADDAGASPEQGPDTLRRLAPDRSAGGSSRGRGARRPR